MMVKKTKAQKRKDFLMIMTILVVLSAIIGFYSGFSIGMEVGVTKGAAVCMATQKNMLEGITIENVIIDINETKFVEESVKQLDLKKLVEEVKKDDSDYLRVGEPLKVTSYGNCVEIPCNCGDWGCLAYCFTCDYDLEGG